MEEDNFYSKNEEKINGCVSHIISILIYIFSVIVLNVLSEKFDWGYFFY